MFAGKDVRVFLLKSSGRKKGKRPIDAGSEIIYRPTFAGQAESFTLKY